MTCDICNKKITKLQKEDSYERNGKFYHNVCFNDNFWLCEGCSFYQDHDSISHEVEGESLCNSCFNLHYAYCVECNEATSQDHGYNDVYYCNDCYNDNFTECSQCGEVHFTDNLNYCEECEIDYCDDCSCNCDNLNPLSEDNFRQGKPIKGFNFTDFIGVEIECFSENHASDLELDHCRIGDDSSINSSLNTFEIKTLPASGDALLKLIKYNSHQLKSHGFAVNNSCGLHIHIDCRKLAKTPQKLSQLLLTYYAFEDCLYSLLPKNRWSNSFCQPLWEHYTFEELKNKKLDKLEAHWYKGPSKKYDHHDDSRYHSFNLHSVFYRGTLEVRCHSGTVDADKIINWIYILLKIKQWAKKHYNPKFIAKMAKKRLNFKKIDLFLDTFNFKKEIKSYILERIRKFNPYSLQPHKYNYWLVKFNYIKTKDILSKTRLRLYQFEHDHKANPIPYDSLTEYKKLKTRVAKLDALSTLQYQRLAKLERD